MRKSFWSLGVAFAVLLVTAMGAAAQPVPASAARGEAILKRDCTTCHGIGPAGGSPMREAPSFAEIAARADLEMLRGALQRGILSGHPTMPKLSLGQEAVEAIMSYLWSVRGR